MIRHIPTGLFLGRYTAEDWLVHEHGCSVPEAAEIVALHLRTDRTVKAQDLLTELAQRQTHALLPCSETAALPILKETPHDAAP